MGAIGDAVCDTTGDPKDALRRLGCLKERFARMEGGFDAMRARLDAMPTVWHFTLGLIATVVAVAALFASMR